MIRSAVQHARRWYMYWDYGATRPQLVATYYGRIGRQIASFPRRSCETMADALEDEPPWSDPCSYVFAQNRRCLRRYPWLAWNMLGAAVISFAMAGLLQERQREC